VKLYAGGENMKQDGYNIVSDVLQEISKKLVTKAVKHAGDKSANFLKRAQDIRRAPLPKNRNDAKTAASAVKNLTKAAERAGDQASRLTTKGYKKFKGQF
jgi:hypothetical protein